MIGRLLVAFAGVAATTVVGKETKFVLRGPTDPERVQSLSEGLLTVADATPPPFIPADLPIAEAIKMLPEANSRIPRPSGNHSELGESISKDAELLGEELIKNAALAVEEIIRSAKLLQLRIEVEAARLVQRIQSNADELVGRTDVIVDYRNDANQ